MFGNCFSDVKQVSVGGGISSALEQTPRYTTKAFKSFIRKEGRGVCVQACVEEA